MAKITMYTGKNQAVKLDSDSLLTTDVDTLKAIPYVVARKYPEYIAMLEACIKDNLDVARDIHDELSYDLAIAEMCIIINGEEEEEEITMETANNVNVTNVTAVSANAQEVETMNTINNAATNNNTTNQEEKTMGRTIIDNVNGAVNEMMDKFTGATKSVIYQAGKTREEYVEKVDDSINVLHGAFGNVLNTLDTVVGYSILKNSILDILEAGSNDANSKKDLFAMAKRCRELVEEEIENLEAWADEDSLKKATQLKALTEGARGKSVFEAFVSGLLWIARTLTKKLTKWVEGLDEKSILGSIFRAVAGFVGILRAGVVFVWNTVKFAVSFVVAGVLKVADFIFRAIATLVSKVKGWATSKLQKVTEEELCDEGCDFVILEDDEDDCVPAN